VLIIALMGNPLNSRIFERADGLLAISVLLRDPETTESVKKTVLEFLYLYLLPEEPEQPSNEDTGTTRRIRTSSGKSTTNSKGSTGSRAGTEDSSISELDDRTGLKTVKEKQKLLSKYFNNVAGLPHEFELMNVFGSR
jgi:hypothetical protein